MATQKVAAMKGDRAEKRRLAAGVAAACKAQIRSSFVIATGWRRPAWSLRNRARPGQARIKPRC